MNADESMPSTCWFDGRPVSVCRPKFAAVAVPVTWTVSVRAFAWIFTLPVRVSTLAEPPEMVPSAVCSSARVETSPTPVPKTMFRAGFDPIWTVIVWPCEAALCVSRLVGSTVPTEMPNSLTRLGDVLPMAIAWSADVLASTRWPVPSKVAADMPVGSEPAALRRLPVAKPIEVSVVELPASVTGSASAELRTTCPPITEAETPSVPPATPVSTALILLTT